MSGLEKTQEIDKTDEQISKELSNDESSDEAFVSRGVKRMENIRYAMENTKQGKTMRTVFIFCFILCYFILSLNSLTTASYQPYATSSFQKHSMLSTLAIVTNLLSSVSKPMISKIGDITSRPTIYSICLVLYTLGYIISAASNSISTFIVGSVFTTVGYAGIDLTNTVVLCEITPLKYRGVMIGISAFPNVITVWIAGSIVNHFVTVNWRWGYGLFAILTPAVIAPCIICIIYAEHISQKLNIESSTKQEKVESWPSFVWKQILEMDFVGMIIMAFGWTLLLLPFSLKTSAIDGYSNPSLIAMFIVGAVLLIAYGLYETYLAPFPSMPKRVLLNRTFIIATFIYFFYMASSALLLLYLSSYVGVIKTWSYAHWTYFNNTLTVSMSFFSLVVGVIMRLTHRSKFLESIGLLLQIVAMIIALWARYDHASTGALVWVQILVGVGAACSLVISQVAAQASVPHQDVALTVALLEQWGAVGYAVGVAIAGAIWENKLPALLRKYMPPSVSDADVLSYYGDFQLIQEFPIGSGVRDGAILAYNHVMYYLFVCALAFSGFPFVLSFLQRNYFLGDSINSVESDFVENFTLPKTRFEKFWLWFDNPWEYKKRIQDLQSS